MDKAIEKRRCVNCTMKHEDVYFNFIPLCRSDDFVLAAHDPDFSLDGYIIFPLENVSRVEIKEGIYNEIMQREGISANIDIPRIELRSYRGFFETFLEYGTPVSLDTKDGYFIGNVVKAGNKNVRFSHFNADGKRLDPVKISYDDIYVIYFGNRYTEMFSKYAEPFTDI